MANSNNNSKMYEKYRVTEDEFSDMCKKYKNLYYSQAWQVLRGNHKNNHTLDMEDLMQEQMAQAVKSIIYLKKFRYLEKCFVLCEKYVKTKKDKKLMESLKEMWASRKKHGAGRSNFSAEEEVKLETLLSRIAPKEEIPNPQDPIDLDAAFGVYLKSCSWNSVKAIGRNITKEKSLRVGMCSLSDHDYLGCYEEF